MGFGLLRSDGSDLGQSRAWLCLTGGGGIKTVIKDDNFLKVKKKVKEINRLKRQKQKKRKREKENVEKVFWRELKS